MQKVHGPLSRCDRQVWTKMHYLWHSWPTSNDLKHTDARFFSDSKGSIRLRVTQVPRSSKLAIFALLLTMTTTTIDIQTNCFTSCTWAWGNYSFSSSGLLPCMYGQGVKQSSSQWSKHIQTLQIQEGSASGATFQYMQFWYTVQCISSKNLA